MLQPYEHPVTCAVCGGDGLADSQTASSQWTDRAEVIIHSDPSVCRDELQRFARQLVKVQNALIVKIAEDDVNEEQHF